MEIPGSNVLRGKKRPLLYPMGDKKEDRMLGECSVWSNSSTNLVERNSPAGSRHLLPSGRIVEYQAEVVREGPVTRRSSRCIRVR